MRKKVDAFEDNNLNQKVLFYHEDGLVYNIIFPLSNQYQFCFKASQRV